MRLKETLNYVHSKCYDIELISMTKVCDLFSYTMCKMSTVHTLKVIFFHYVTVTLKLSYDYLKLLIVRVTKRTFLSPPNFPLKIL